MLQDMRDREGDVFDGQLRKVRNENDDLKERLSKAESALAALQSERDDLAFLANGQIENTDEGTHSLLALQLEMTLQFAPHDRDF